MRDHDERAESLDAAREAMRERLVGEFHGLHRRRRRRRSVAIALAPVALLTAALGIWSSDRYWQPDSPLPTVEPLADGSLTAPSPQLAAAAEAENIAEASHAEASPKSMVFDAFDYIELEPEDLPKWLAEAESDLLVYTVGGRTHVVSERELLTSAAAKRKARLN